MHPVDVMRSELESINSSREARSVTALIVTTRSGGSAGPSTNCSTVSDAPTPNAHHSSPTPGTSSAAPVDRQRLAQLLSGELTPQRRAIVAERASG